ncbi:MAG TPA: metallophosphoesterase [Chloroflexota bacterium]
MLLWIAAAGTLLLSAALLLGLYAVLVEPYRPVLRRLVVQVPANWPRLSILHLSDLHVRADADRLHRAQEQFLRSLTGTPDLVCVTGDVCEHLVAAPRAVALLGLVRSRLGTLVVLGNHEHHAPIPAGLRRPNRRAWGRLARLASRLLGARVTSSGSDEARAIGVALGASGLRVLTNEGVRLEIDGRRLWVAGTDSEWAGRARAAAALAGREDGEPCLGLVHEPESALPLIARGADLALAGHLHGGQVRLPLVGAPHTYRADARIRVAAGVQRLGRAVLYISAGLGHTTPLRFGCRPEATWIECLPASPASPPSHLAETPVGVLPPNRRALSPAPAKP